MHLQVAPDDSGQYVFSIHEDERLLFSSNCEMHPFSGEWGTYASEKDAVCAASMMLFRNGHLLERLAVNEEISAEERRDTVREEVVGKLVGFYQGALATFRTLADDRDEGEDREERISALLQSIDQNIQIVKVDRDLTVKREGEDDPVVKQLRQIQRLFKKLRQKVVKRLGEPKLGQQAGNRVKMVREAAVSAHFADILRDVAADYTENVAEAVGYSDVRVVDISASSADSWLVAAHAREGRFAIEIASDLTLCGVYDLGGNFGSHMSDEWYNSVFMPVLRRVGHYRFGDVVVVPESAKCDKRDADIKACLKGFRTSNNQPIACVIRTGGGGRTKSRSMRISLSEAGPDKEGGQQQKLQDFARQLAESNLVRVTRRGSRYEGVSGTVDINQIAMRPGYVEFPLEIEYANGLRQTVWFTNNDVEIFFQ